MKPTSLFVLLIIAFSACTSTKETGGSSAETKTETSKDLSSQGFESAKVVTGISASDECAFLIELENGQLLEPQVLSSEYHKTGLSIWIKYLPQRRPSRCGKAMPVSISEIVLP